MARISHVWWYGHNTELKLNHKETLDNLKMSDGLPMEDRGKVCWGHENALALTRSHRENSPEKHLVRNLLKLMVLLYITM